LGLLLLEHSSSAGFRYFSNSISNISYQDLTDIAPTLLIFELTKLGLFAIYLDLSDSVYEPLDASSLDFANRDSAKKSWNS